MDALRGRLAELVEEIEASTFRETKFGRRGYNERDVDDFLDYAIDVLLSIVGENVALDELIKNKGSIRVRTEPAGDAVDETEPTETLPKADHDDALDDTTRTVESDG